MSHSILHSSAVIVSQRHCCLTRTDPICLRPTLRHSQCLLQHRGRQSSCRGVHELAELCACFDRACQKRADDDALLSIAVPLVVFILVAASFVWRELNRDAEALSDPETGAMWEARPELPELDRQGKLIFKAISYTPWPVPPSAPGERLRVPVGPVADRTMRTYLFQRVLPEPSRLVTVTLPRPMGVTLQEDPEQGRAVVAGFLRKSEAERLNKVGMLSGGSARGAVMKGDILRAVTCTTLQYDTSALFGAKPAKRVVVLYGADRQSWPQVAVALQRGSAEDGDVTLVLERAGRSGDASS